MTDLDRYRRALEAIVMRGDDEPFAAVIAGHALGLLDDRDEAVACAYALIDQEMVH